MPGQFSVDLHRLARRLQRFFSLAHLGAGDAGLQQIPSLQIWGGLRPFGQRLSTQLGDLQIQSAQYDRFIRHRLIDLPQLLPVA